MKTKLTTLLGIALLSLVLSPLQAQAQEGVREPVDHDHVISGNPLILLAGWFNAEYERKVAETMTVGISGGWLDLDEDDYTSVNGFFRYYPQAAAFTGFYLGGRAGIHRVNEADYADDGGDSHTAFGIGVDIGYAWLLGPGRSFYVGLGIGATRLLAGDLDASATIPSLRLINVGIAF
jgi:hypothetical protein